MKTEKPKKTTPKHKRCNGKHNKILYEKDSYRRGAKNTETDKTTIAQEILNGE